MHCNICIVRVQLSSVEVEVDTGNKWFSKLIMFAVLSFKHIFSSAVNGSLAVQGALCTVHCALCKVQSTRCRVQGAFARQEVVTGWLPRDPYIPTSPTIGSKLSTLPVPDRSNLAALTDSTPTEMPSLSCSTQQMVNPCLLTSWSSTQTSGKISLHLLMLFLQFADSVSTL